MSGEKELPTGVLVSREGPKLGGAGGELRIKSGRDTRSDICGLGEELSLVHGASNKCLGASAWFSGSHAFIDTKVTSHSQSTPFITLFVAAASSIGCTNSLQEGLECRQ